MTHIIHTRHTLHTHTHVTHSIPHAQVQNSYSLLQRSDEMGLVEAMARHDIGYLPYSPLSAGVLSGKYRGLKCV